MKKDGMLIGVVVALLFLFGTAHATDLSKSEFESEMKPNKLQRSNHMEDMANIRFDKHIVCYDSASLDSFIQAYMLTAHIPGLATWCFKNGQVIWQQCYGYANLEDSIEVADTTLFSLASISKTITGTAIMQLWERGIFGLDDDINDYLPFNVRNPNYPGSAITFRMIMTHTSSIQDNSAIIGPLWVPWGDSPIPLGTFLQGYLVPGGTYYHLNNYNNAVPGAQYEYSNVAIGLLGYLVEAIEDSFPIHCQDSIFHPLNMDKTSWFLATLDTNNLARAYQWMGSSYSRRPWWGGPFYPAAQLRSSSVELAQYLTAIVQYGVIDTVRILDSTTVELILSHQFEVGTDWWIGLIWHHIGWLFAGRWVWLHNGAGDGVDTFMGICLDENSAVIALANCENYGCSWTVAEALFDYAQEYVVEELEPSQPVAIALQINPNPFSKLTKISFGNVQDAKSIELKIYDATGRLVKSFRPTPNALRSTQISWDGIDQANRQLPSGVYFVKFAVSPVGTTGSGGEAGGYTETKKLLLIK